MGEDASTAREQLAARTCEWCGEAVDYSGRGRPPRYCGPVHRRRAWELRTAQERAERPLEDGGQIALQQRDLIPPAPRPAQRLSGQAYTLPEDAVEWVEALAALRQDVNNPKIFLFREQIARACERTVLALRADTASRCYR
ncbi:hypothetical protein [Streptomyces sp. NPDC002491]